MTTELLLTIILANEKSHPLVREGTPYGQDSNFQEEKNNWSWAPDGVRRFDMGCPMIEVIYF
jgi:hypothetical protein